MTWFDISLYIYLLFFSFFLTYITSIYLFSVCKNTCAILQKSANTALHSAELILYHYTSDWTAGTHEFHTLMRDLNSSVCRNHRGTHIGDMWRLPYLLICALANKHYKRARIGCCGVVLDFLCTQKPPLVEQLSGLLLLCDKVNESGSLFASQRLKAEPEPAVRLYLDSSSTSVSPTASRSWPLCPWVLTNGSWWWGGT